MTTTPTPDPLLDRLVADCTPVQPLRPRQGGLLVLGLALLVTMVVGALWDFRADVAALDPAGIVMLRSAALLVVGIAALAAAVASARPWVGSRVEGWHWALLVAATIPAAALASALLGEARLADVMTDSVAWCFGISLSSAAILAAALTGWLRRGAVTEPVRAAWLTGVAAGAFGTFAYSLHCPSSSLHYTGLWYSLTVGISAFAGRLVLPRLLRW